MSKSWKALECLNERHKIYDSTHILTKDNTWDMKDLKVWGKGGHPAGDVRRLGIIELFCIQRLWDDDVILWTVKTQNL